MICGECGNVTAPGAGFPNHVYCKRFLLHMEKREDASRCRYFIPKPITNYDSVIRKTPEALAEFLAEYRCVHKAPHCIEANCAQCWLDWLKEEVKE